jgi:hypothetical protein
MIYQFEGNANLKPRNSRIGHLIAFPSTSGDASWKFAYKTV